MFWKCRTTLLRVQGWEVKTKRAQYTNSYLDTFQGKYEAYFFNTFYYFLILKYFYNVQCTKLAGYLPLVGNLK